MAKICATEKNQTGAFHSTCSGGFISETQIFVKKYPQHSFTTLCLGWVRSRLGEAGPVEDVPLIQRCVEGCV